jgi:hypothetical protein
MKKEGAQRNYHQDCSRYSIGRVDNPFFTLRRVCLISIARMPDRSAGAVLTRLDGLFQSVAWLIISALTGLLMLKIAGLFLFGFEEHFNA